MLSARPGGGRLVTELVTEGFNNIGYDIIDDLKKHAIISRKTVGAVARVWRSFFNLVMLYHDTPTTAHSYHRHAHTEEFFQFTLF